MNARPVRFLIASSLFFLICRVLFIIAPIPALEVPRLGDDGLFYLVKGQAFYQGYTPDYPAAQSTKELFLKTYSTDPQVALTQWKVIVAVSDALTPMYDMLTGLVLKLDLAPKWSFALTELICAITMTCALALFLTQYFGASAAAWGLLLLNFAILPNQGLHYFIPSTFALSLGLLFICYMGRSVSPPKSWIAFVSAFYLSGVHLIGKVYVGMGLLVYLSGLKRNKRPFSFSTLLPVLLASLGIVLWWILLPVFLPSLARAFPVAPGASSLWQIFWFNVTGAGEIVAFVMRHQFYLLPFAFLTLVRLAMDYRSASRRKTDLPTRSLIIFVVVTLMILSLFHKFPYPAEVFSRFLVVFCILLAGYSGLEIARGWSLRLRAVRVGIVCFLGGALVYSGGHWVDYLFDNLHFRSPIIHQEALRAQLSELVRSDAKILYGETDFSFRAALLNGGRSVDAFAYPLAAKDPGLKEELELFSPTVGVVPTFTTLNSLSFQQKKTLQPHYLGFPLSSARRLRLSNFPKDTGRFFYFFVDNPGNDFSIRFSTANGEHGTVSVPANTLSWCAGRLPPSVLRSAPVEIELPENQAWIKGISFSPPDSTRLWPWDSGLDVEVSYENPVVYDKQRFTFSLEALLNFWDMQRLWEIYGGRLQVISDNSGLVFFRIEPVDP